MGAKKKGKKGRQSSTELKAIQAHAEAWEGNPAGEEYLLRFCTMMRCREYQARKDVTEALFQAVETVDRPDGEDRLATAQAAYDTVDRICQERCQFSGKKYQNSILHDSQAISALALQEDAKPKTGEFYQPRQRR